jgi:hypothetical protein
MLDEILAQFDIGTTVTIEIVLPGQYRVGWDSPIGRFVPGLGTYYPLEEAMQYALDVFKAHKQTVAAIVKAEKEGKEWTQ